MGLDAGYHNAAVAHLLTKAGIQGVIGYRRHTFKNDYLGKYRFRYDFDFDVYICPEHKPLYWKTTNRLGYREYYRNHGLRNARMVGLANMCEQCFLTCAVQNMTKMAKALFCCIFSFLTFFSSPIFTQKTYA